VEGKSRTREVDLAGGRHGRDQGCVHATELLLVLVGRGRGGLLGHLKNERMGEKFVWLPFVVTFLLHHQRA